MIEKLLIALALAMDCFTISVVCGVISRRWKPSVMLRIAFLFGLFQAAMPLAGWFLTESFMEYIQAWDHWLAFAMLAFIGGKMIWDSFKGDSGDMSIAPERLSTEILLAVATSIDALAVGITYACTGYDTISSLVSPLVIIGVVSFMMSILGSVLGCRFGDAVSRKVRPELIGGLILVCIGLKILLEHLGLI